MKKIIFILCFWSALPALAAQKIETSYEAFGLGLNLIEATMVLTTDAPDFIMQTDVKTKGLLSIFLDSQQKLVSKGYEQTPIYSMMTRKGKEKVLDFTSHPTFKDYQTALLTVMQGTPQTTRSAVWDGKRELLLTFTYQGSSVLPVSGDAVYQGSADFYTLTIDVTKGKKKGWFFERTQNKDNPPLRLWFKDVLSGHPPLLVRADFDTALFGKVEIHLKSARLSNEQGH